MVYVIWSQQINDCQKIPREHFKRGLHKMGIRLTSKEYDTLFAKFANSNNNEVDYATFAGIMEAIPLS